MILDAAAGRIPAYVDTGLNLVHVDDVGHGHLLALRHGRIGERYILGSENLTLARILGMIAELVGRRPPRLELPVGAVLPLALVGEAWARISGRPPRVSLDELRMARKRMFFSSAKAQAELGYAPRPGREAVADSIAWFRANGYLP
jgi:dihydroflavonol-4-reductase